MQSWQIEKVSVQCLLTLECMGVEYLHTNNFSEARTLMTELGKSLGPANNPDKLLLTESNSLWVFGLVNGQPVIGGGIRTDDLGTEDVQSFLPRSVKMIFDTTVDNCSYEVFEGRHWGRAAYLGNFASNLAHGLGSSGRDIVRLFTAYTHHRVFSDLGVDTTYCFIRRRESHKGLSYGFMRCDPFVWSTTKPMFSDGNPEWVMSLERNMLPSLMGSVVPILSERLSINQQFVPTVITNDPASGSHKRQSNVKR